MSKLVIHGLYKVKDKYFRDFQNPFWVDNKNENRPYYYLMQDPDRIEWLIPMSSQTENYKAKIENIEKRRGRGNCTYYHIGKIATKERVFLISDMFPITSEYIKNPFFIGQIHYIVKDESLNRVIYSKAMRYLSLVEGKKISSRNDIMGIKAALLAKRN